MNWTRWAPSAAFAAIALLACGAVPGGTLPGTAVAPPADWSFLAEDQPCRIETSGPDQRSLLVGCYSVSGRLYVHSHRFTDVPRLFGRSWVEDVRENPLVRVRIEDDLYELRAVEELRPEARQRILGARGHDPPPEGMRLFELTARSD